jgi:hypothetical protein
LRKFDPIRTKEYVVNRKGLSRRLDRLEHRQPVDPATWRARYDAYMRACEGWVGALIHGDDHGPVPADPYPGPPNPEGTRRWLLGWSAGNLLWLKPDATQEDYPWLAPELEAEARQLLAAAEAVAKDMARMEAAGPAPAFEE